MFDELSIEIFFLYSHEKSAGNFFLGDIIIKEGTIGTKMYFIQEGVVDIVMANGEVSSQPHQYP